MSDLVKIGAAFSLIVVLLRLRWNLGLVMFAAALFLGTLYRIAPSASSGAIEALPVFFKQSGLPIGVVLFALPFIVGLLTGLTVGFVGATFPIITAMLGGTPDLGSITFAFASGFAGVMLSPAHLCLLLTIQYFKADTAGAYRLMYVPVLLVFSVGLIRLWV